MRHPLLSHTELESWRNTLSISLDSLLRLMSISMIVLSFSTKLFSAALALVGTWSSRTSTNSQISDQPTWTRLVPPLFNGRLSPSIYPIQTLGRRYLNHATVGMRGYAHLRLLSVADSTFAANAPNPDISTLTVQLDFSCFWLPHAFARSPIHNLIQPPRVQLGVLLK